MPSSNPAFRGFGAAGNGRQPAWGTPPQQYGTPGQQYGAPAPHDQPGVSYVKPSPYSATTTPAGVSRRS